LHDQEPRVPTRDLADPRYARRSLRASSERRVRLARRRRATSGGRRAIVAATCLLAVGAGGAMAQETSGGNDGSAKTTASTAGYDVKAMQRKLGIPADGVVGPQTRKAIKRFQKKSGLKADGIVGPATLEALGLSQKAKDAPATETEAAPTASGSNANEDVAAHLAAIAQCESGGDPTAISPDGKYRGKYQFLRETWEAMGGSGDPAEAPESEQDLRAAALYEKQGPNAWPVCSKQ
jgi:peptidoglycan hydrolase-like protein with peptidoglycan-binding domain